MVANHVGVWLGLNIGMAACQTVASLALAFFVSFVPPCSLLKDDVASATGTVSRSVSS